MHFELQFSRGGSMRGALLLVSQRLCFQKGEKKSEMGMKGWRQRLLSNCAL